MEEPVRYDTAVKILLERIPEFRAARVQQDDSLPYVVFGDFAIFLRNRISAGMTSDSVTVAAFDLLNDMVISSDSDVVNLVVVGVFEILADRADCIKVARQLLSRKARGLFEDVLAVGGEDSKAQE